jgi:hypothetical protein
LGTIQTTGDVYADWDIDQCSVARDREHRTGDGRPLRRSTGGLN